MEEEKISAEAGSVGAGAAFSSSSQLNKDGGRQEQEQICYTICYIFARREIQIRLCNDLIFGKC